MKTSNSAVPTAPAAHSDQWKGTTRFEVLGCLGRGGAGIVYEALDRESRQRVALKTLLRFSPDALYQFKQEFRALADVVHPNLVHLHELVAADGDSVFFTMELIPGTDFLAHLHPPTAQRPSHRPAPQHTQIVGRWPSRPPPAVGADSEGVSPGAAVATRAADFSELRRHLRQLVDGVQAIHAAGKLHRDIKPSNVRVTPEGRVVILDFGLAMELPRDVADLDVEDEHIVGTASYMAPEQALGERLTAACDWYSVGVMLFEAIVGRPPFTGTAVEVLTQKSAVQPAPPSRWVEDVPDDLDALCHALLHPDPQERPAGPEILRILGGRRSDPVPRPKMPSGPTLLVGRGPQLRALREAFEATRQERSVTVRVGGTSGMGKSIVVHHFLDDLVERGEAVVLEGRAYERESVPYKAIDGVIDALSRYLLRAEQHGGRAVPPDIWTLASVFPVLRRIPGVEDVPLASFDDPQRVRQRAFGVLRELFASMGRSHPLVVFIDDSQWGDADSAALLVELMRPPQAPPLLLIMTYRTEDAERSPFLLETRARWAPEADVRDLRVGPLEIEEAHHLALALLESNDSSMADSIAKESGGNPFLVEELARSASTHLRIHAAASGQATAPITLEEVLGERIARLPDAARRLLEVVAIAGRPLPVTTLREASHIGEAEEVVTVLRSQRFVRAGFREGREVIEASHDRIRETIVAQLALDVARGHHGQLARALEIEPEVNAEAIAVHLIGAGEASRAAPYAERAAEQAAAKLAFDRAAHFFQIALQTAPDKRRLQKRLGEVLEWAGRGEQAARAYLDAADGAQALERVDLERAAAEQYLFCGRLDEGAAVLRRVLEAVGLDTPSSTLGAVSRVIAYRIWLAARGLKFRERTSAEVAPEDRVRIDALYTVAQGYAIVDVVLGACMTTRHTIAALEAGDRFQVARATILEAVQHATKGGNERARERALTDIARRASDGDAEGQAYVSATRGVALFFHGRWREAREMLDQSYSQVATYPVGKANAGLYALYSLVFSGALREAAERQARMLADAEQRGDLYTSVGLRAGNSAIVWLAADQPETARRHVRESMKKWPRSRFLVQHFRAMICEAEIELYVGRGDEAYTRLEQDARALKRSMMLGVQYTRSVAAFARGRAAIASIEGDRTHRKARLAEARRVAGNLDREHLPWTSALASLVAAAAANADGRSATSIAALRAAIDHAQVADMTIHAAAARYQLGATLGGDEGRRLAADGEHAMKDQGVRDPARFASLLLPGRWTPR